MTDLLTHDIETEKIRRGEYLVHRDDGETFKVSRRSTPGTQWVVFHEDADLSLARADTLKACKHDIADEWLRWE